METWLKVVLALVGVGILAIAAICFVLLSMAGECGKNMMDPEKTARLADQIAVLEKPLPGEWAFSAGMNIGVMKMVVLVNTNDKTVITLTRYAKTKAPDSVAQGAAAGAQMAIEETGKEKLRGHNMSFIRGRSKDSAMEICTLVADDGDLVLIHSLEPAKRKFDRALVNPILERIKSIH